MKSGLLMLLPLLLGNDADNNVTIKSPAESIFPFSHAHLPQDSFVRERCLFEIAPTLLDLPLYKYQTHSCMQIEYMLRHRDQEPCFRLEYSHPDATGVHFKDYMLIKAVVKGMLPGISNNQKWDEHHKIMDAADAISEDRIKNNRCTIKKRERILFKRPKPAHNSSKNS